MIKQLEDQGIVRASISPWASPISGAQEVGKNTILRRLSSIEFYYDRWRFSATKSQCLVAVSGSTVFMF